MSSTRGINISQNLPDTAKFPAKDFTEENRVRRSEVTISSGTLLDSSEGGISLLSAVTGSVLVLEQLVFKKAAGTAYAGEADIEIRYKDASGTKATADIPIAFLNSTALTYAIATAIDCVPVVGEGLYLVISTNPTTGDSDLVIDVTYRVVS